MRTGAADGVREGCNVRTAHIVPTQVGEWLQPELHGQRQESAERLSSEAVTGKRTVNRRAWRST